MSPGVPPASSARWRLAASCTRYLETVVSRVRFFSFSRVSTASPSASPAMIWSRMFFWVQASLQNAHVFASSLRENQEVVECLAFLLYSRSEGASLHGLIDFPVNVGFDGCDHVFGALTLCVS